LDGLFFSQTATRVLRVLSRHPERSYTGRELAAASGTPHHRAAGALRRLEKEGMVSSRVVGNAYVWQLRPRNPLLGAVRELFRAEQTAAANLTSLVRRTLGRAAGIDELVLFGSAARGEEGPGSDIDLLVIVSNAAGRGRVERPLVALREKAWEVFGTRVRPIVYTRAEYVRKRELPLVRSIEADGIRIDLRGGTA